VAIAAWTGRVEVASRTWEFDLRKDDEGFHLRVPSMWLPEAPVSVTLMRNLPAAGASNWTVTRPFARLYLTAFDSRLSRIWLSRWRSASTK
jgi:hypothetical protein